ncbi:MAG: D-alanine--D-alanine ligase A [Bacillus thermozeamaize]|uniref:D-alanine--D-alanine ligase n=1 Tax=Bacillus thermozeamaize TaxID=230954 RepID=A0A1Y3PHN8_9BACI|nr:MAG: D-alanine--D-alanine ligase A [Bacillus thermozeamaize]
MTEKIRLALLYGGKSGEHEVSIQTAFSVLNALDLSRYEPIPTYITLDGTWIQGETITRPPASPEQLRLDGQNGSCRLAVQGLSGIFPACRSVAPPGQPKGSPQDVDVVFPLLHGPNGEDGTVQGLLELADIPYVGSGVLASAVGMDKAMMKTVFASRGLPQVDYLVYTRNHWEKNRSGVLEEIIDRLGLPCFVKPANLGSSVGISKPKTKEELLTAMDTASRFDRKIIVEAYVDAREIEVAILGNDEPLASIPGEIIPSKEFYDYEAKYLDGQSALIIPAELPESTVRQIQEMAIEAFKAIDASGLSRVDFFLCRSDGRVLINEINTMPGFTQYSMYPLLWQHSGISYPQLIDRLIQLALERHEEKKKTQIFPDSLSSSPVSSTKKT